MELLAVPSPKFTEYRMGSGGVTLNGVEGVMEDTLENSDGVIIEENRLDFSEYLIGSDKFNVVTLDGMESVTEDIPENSDGVIFEENRVDFSEYWMASDK